MSDIFSLGEWLRRRRKLLDLTQAELAARVGCSADLIHKLEGDSRRPSRQTATRLAAALGLAGEEQVAFVQAARAARSPHRLSAPSLGAPVPRLAPSPSADARSVERGPAALPRGTVTLLATDIARSTQLWELHPGLMPAVLARHDALLRRVVAAHGGVIFKTMGDGVLAAFAIAPAALAAALEAQRAIAAEAWGLPVPLLVGMALHSGAPELRDGDYHGRARGERARSEPSSVRLSKVTDDRNAHRPRRIQNPSRPWLHRLRPPG